jgi:flagellar biosynthesis chaperone FliJ
MTTIYQPFAEYRTDGATRRYTFGFPYLARTHVVVTRDGGAPALFDWIDDHTVDVHTLFNEPLPADEPLKIFRVTPDLDAFAQFKSASLMTSDDLNRARLQVLYLIQERSGGIAGSVGNAINVIANEIETISGALDSLAYSQGQLQSGLQTIGVLGARMEVVENGQAALQQLIDETIADLDGNVLDLKQRVDAVESRQGNLEAGVTSSINTLIANDMAFASRVDTVEAKVDAIDTSGDDNAQQDTDIIAASIIMSAIAEAKSHYSQARTLETLQAQFGDTEALIQEERVVRAEADSALAQQITTLQTEIGENISQVIEDMKTSVDLVEGKVATIAANYTLKVLAQREDGRQVMAGIGLNATSSNDYTGSEIILAAEKLLFVDSSSPNGALVPMFTAGSVDGSPTFVIPSAVFGDRMYPGRLLVDGSIEGRSIAADTITGDRIKAGSISAEQINVSGGTNRAWNSEMVEMSGSMPKQWNIGGNTLGWCSWGRDLDASWAISAGHTAFIKQTATDGNVNIHSANSYVISDPIPIDPGERYEFFAHVGTHRCDCDIYVTVYDAAGNSLLNSAWAAGQNDCKASEGFTGGQVASGYKKIGGFVKPPPGAATARMVLRKASHATGIADSYLFWTKPFLAPCNPNQTRFSPYNTSGLGTFITPSGISTPSLSALTANIGLLRTATSGQRVEIDSNGGRVYDGNNVLRLQWGVW